MFLDDKYQLEALTDPKAYQTYCKQLYVTKKRAVASDGKSLAVVKVKLGEKDSEPEGYLDPQVLLSSRKKSQNIVLSKDTVTDENGSVLGKRANKDFAPYPDFAKVIKQAMRNKGRKLLIDAKSLYNLSLALGADQVEITLPESDDKDQPLLVMPKIKEKKNKVYGAIKQEPF